MQGKIGGDILSAIKQTFTFPNGETIELFSIGTLALALGRTPNCMRQWEISGVLPKTCFRSRSGVRLYSQEQIDAVVRCAEKAKITRGVKISDSSFIKNVRKEFDALERKYRSIGGSNSAEISKD